MNSFLKIMILVFFTVGAVVEAETVREVAGIYSFVSDAEKNLKVYIPPKIKEKYPAEVLQAIAAGGDSVKIDYRQDADVKKFGLQKAVTYKWKELVYQDGKVSAYWDSTMKTEVTSYRIELVLLSVTVVSVLFSHFLLGLIYRKFPNEQKVIVLTVELLTGLTAVLMMLTLVSPALTSGVASAAALIVLIATSAALPLKFPPSLTVAEALKKNCIRKYVILSIIIYIIVVAAFIAIY